MTNLRSATAKDLLRRPSTRLAIVAAGAIIALIPHVPAPGASARDQVRLTLELGTTTIALIVQLFAGVTAVHASSTDGDRGLSPEVLAAPRSTASSVLARLIGTVQVATLVLAILATVMVATWLPVGITITDIARMTPPLLGAAVGAVTFAALGVAVGRVLRSDLAVLIVVLLPWIPPVCAATNLPAVATAALSAMVPPISGPIHARPYAFGGQVAAIPDLLSVLAALVQAAAWATIAASTPARSAQDPVTSP